MSKHAAPHELILFFNARYSMAELRALGYPASTVAKYQRYFDVAQQKFKEMLKHGDKKSDVRDV
jgi:hypothetical protein